MSNLVRFLSKLLPAACLLLLIIVVVLVFEVFELFTSLWLCAVFRLLGAGLLPLSLAALPKLFMLLL